MPKSNNLFAILVTPTSIKRDQQLSDILGSEKIEYKNKKYIGGDSYSLYFSSDFSYIKTWKTFNGCNRFLETLSRKNPTPSNPPYGLDIDNKFDWSKVTYEIVHIEKEWNSHIDNQITKENDRHNKYIFRLKSLKIK
jgi:hypothetical protein